MNWMPLAPVPSLSQSIEQFMPSGEMRLIQPLKVHADFCGGKKAFPHVAM
jgi:hypothetical protein